MSMPFSLPTNRRQFLRLGFYGTGAGLLGYGSLIERRFPVVERITCPVPERFSGLDGLTVAVMSDFHHDEFHDNALMGRAIAAMNAEEPDLVVFTGDYISHDLQGLDTLGAHFSRIEARMGAYATLGNHDQWTDAEAVRKRIEKGGIECLQNEATTLTAPSGQRFALAGLESIWGGRPDLSRATRGLRSDTPLILGWHEPDPFDLIEDSRLALQLSGHTHGGQVCAPFFGAIKLPAYGKKYVSGLFEGRNDSRLYVTRGIGAMGVPVRFCCQPEIGLITFQAQEDAKSAEVDRIPG